MVTILICLKLHYSFKEVQLCCNNKNEISCREALHYLV